jgi:hypothetical protein
MTEDLTKELADRVVKYCAENPSHAMKNEVYVRKCVRRWMLVDMINETRAALVTANANPAHASSPDPDVAGRAALAGKLNVNLNLLTAELLLCSLETQK